MKLKLIFNISLLYDCIAPHFDSILELHANKISDQKGFALIKNGAGNRKVSVHRLHLVAEAPGNALDHILDMPEDGPCCCYLLSLS